VGLIYDFVGRRITLFVNLMILSATIAWLPYSAPSQGEFIGISVIAGLSFNMIESNPLILDNATQESQGKAQALVIMGINLGSIFGIGVLLTVLRNFDVKIQFYIMAAMNVALAFATPFMVVEPPDLKEKRAMRKRSNQENGGLCKSLKEYFRVVYQSFKK